MRPKIIDISKIRSNLEKTTYPKQGKIKLCQLCENDPKKIIHSLCIKTRRCRIYAGLYTVIKSGEHHGNILQVRRYCFRLGKQFRFLRPALPPGAKRRPPQKRLPANRNPASSSTKIKPILF